MIFLALFIIIPIIEITLFIEVGDQIGLVWTLLLCFATAFIGANLIRMQGLGTMLSARRRMAHNEMPVREMFDGICLAFAGATLITPGFFTDAIGFALLIPPVRDRLQKYILEHFSGQIFSAGGHNAGRPSPFQSANSNIIDAEYERVDSEDNDSNDDNNKHDKP